MKQPKRANFSIIFDGSDGLWPNVYSFENDITKFFESLGMKPIIVKDLKGQNSAEYMIYLTKAEEQVKNMPDPKKVATPTPQSGGMVSTNTGKFVSTNPGKQLSNIVKGINNG